MNIAVMGLKFEEGYTGMFCRHQAQNAIPNGTKVYKCQSEIGDSHKTGSIATVLGSIQTPINNVIFYFIEWEDEPKVAVGITGYKIKQFDRN